jgi:hypothetical protein
MTLSGRWYRSTGRRFWILVLAMSLLGAMLPAWAAKPAPKPAPSCSGKLGQPMLAFFWNYQAYVGNADGTCALALAPVALQYTPPAFAYTGTRYRVVWIADNRDEVKRIAQLRFVIKMVEFTMSNGNIVESRPLAVKELWRDPVTTSESSLSSLSIDSSGGRVIFTRRYAGATELKRIDLASCTPGCAAPTTVWTPEVDTTAFAAEFGRAGDRRIYAAQTFADGVSRMIFIEEAVDGTWQGPRVIASNASGRYAGIYRFGSPSVTRFDWDEAGEPADLLGLLWTASGGGTGGYFDVVRLGPNCTIGGTGACIDNGDATVEVAGISAGWLPRSAEWTPAGNLLRVIDPVDDIYGNNHIETVDPKTENALDLGYGGFPAGLKQ